MNYTSTATHKDKVLTFVIDSSRTILDDEISLYDENDEVDVKIVDKMVKEFNRISNGLIVDYNYQVIDKRNIHLEILFKHVFNKFGEVQRYVNYNLKYDDKTQILEATIHKKDVGLNNVRNCQEFPFSKIQITNTKIDTMNKTVVTATANNDISSYKNHKMIIDFAKRLIYDNYVNIDNYIKLSKRS
jgi:hypothetical protein